jgi:hypothetical protein
MDAMRWHLLVESVALPAAALLYGCSGATITTLGGPDATAADAASGDANSDATIGTDAPTDGGGGGGGDVLLADGGCGCAPFWCGCGVCDPTTIACTVNPPPCGLGCASACPELTQVTCQCENGRCIRGGIDAGGIGCIHDEDCPSGDCCAHAGHPLAGTGQCQPAGSTCCIAACP